MTGLISALIPPFLALVASAALTPMVRSAALSRGQITASRPDRWSKRPTPNVGGVAIVVGFGIAAAVQFLIAGMDVGDVSLPRAVLPIPPTAGLLLAAGMAALLGFVDDRRQLRPTTKLVGQVAAAGVLLVSGIGLWLTGVYIVDLAISLFWFVGITNAMNLLDNMDGLAGGIGAIAAGFLGVVFLLGDQTALAVLSFAFMGSLVGFLLHNYPPARIFMGDTGSLFVGLFLAGLALAPAPGLSRSLFAVFAVPVVVLAIPILDTTFVTVTRMLEGRAVSEGGRDHTSHGLVALGVPEEMALWMLWTLAALGGVIGLVIRTVPRSEALLLGGSLLIVLAIVGAYLLTSRMRRLDSEESESSAFFDRLRRMHTLVPVLTIVMDVALVGMAYYAAYLIRWDPAELPVQLPYFQRTVAIVVIVKLVAFVGVGAYLPSWRHYSLPDVTAMVRANILGTTLTAAVIILTIDHGVGLSRGVLLIDLLLCTAVTIAGRVSFRLIEGATQRWSEVGEPVAIVGPVDQAAFAFDALTNQVSPEFRPVCLVDPDYPRRRSRFRGYPLFGGEGSLVAAVEECGVHRAVLVDLDADHSVTDRIREHLAEEGALDLFVLRLEITRVESLGDSPDEEIEADYGGSFAT